MMKIFKINLADAYLLTCSQGKNVREMIQEHISHNEIVQVDLKNAPITPTFAKECFRLLINDIGRIKFKRYIQLVNLTPASKAIILHIVKQSLFLTF